MLLGHLDTVGRRGNGRPVQRRGARRSRARPRRLRHEGRGRGRAGRCARSPPDELERRRSSSRAPPTRSTRRSARSASSRTVLAPDVRRSSASRRTSGSASRTVASPVSRSRCAAGRRTARGRTSASTRSRRREKCSRGSTQLARDLLAREPHPLLGTPSVHASLISGGQEFSSYPERCLSRASGARSPARPTPRSPPRLRRSPRASTRRRGSSSAARRSRLIPPHELARAVAQPRPAPTSVEGVPFWTDGALFAAAGIPTVIFGPRGTGAHAAEEWVEVESLVRCASVYAESVRRSSLAAG